MKKIIVILLMYPLLSSAQSLSLSCVDPKDNFTIAIELDEKNNMVFIQGTRQFANYTSNTITFNFEINGETWLHVINRNNGAMMVQRQSDKTILSSFKCNKAVKIF
jgi:hypothetical protein